MLNAFAPPVCRVRFAVPSDVLINDVKVVELPACTLIVLGMVYAGGKGVLPAANHFWYVCQSVFSGSLGIQALSGKRKIILGLIVGKTSTLY
jgi:uncharacterized membrane protein YgdD (TMEM256/DUF423 family)